MPQVKLSDYVVERISEATGAKHVFTLTGGMAMHLVESFGTHPGFTVVPTHHEQAAGIAAAAYGRVLDLPGVVLVTAGPGALNAVTPCAGAWMESTPLVVVSGQVSRANSCQGHPLRQRGVQEAHIVQLVQSITKYAVRIDDPESVALHLDRGLRLMREGRPGPVWFDIPVDVQGSMVDSDKLLRDVQPRSAQADAPLGPVTDRILRELRAAKRPLLLLGHGLRLAGAAELAVPLVESLGVPFQTSWNGMDLVGDEHPLYAGRANLFGARYANLIIQNADFVLALGARFGIQHTGYDVEGFCRGAKLVMVDIDPAEMNKPELKVGERIRADAGAFVRSLLTSISAEIRVAELESDWQSYCRRVRQRFAPLPICPDPTSSYVDPKYFIGRLAQAMPANAVFPFGSSGMGHTVTGGFFATKRGQRVFTFKGLAGMGFGLPSAIGVAVAAPSRPVFTVIGEGGLQLNLQELQTAKEFALPIKVIVLDNGGYHSIRMTQKAFFAGHFVGSGPESRVTFPPLSEVAALYRMTYFRIQRDQEVDEVLARFIGEPGASILEVAVDPDRPLEPRVASARRADGTMVSRPLEDMAPLLDREELRQLMYIPLRDIGS